MYGSIPPLCYTLLSQGCETGQITTNPNKTLTFHQDENCLSKKDLIFYIQLIQCIIDKYGVLNLDSQLKQEMNPGSVAKKMGGLRTPRIPRGGLVMDPSQDIDYF